ncbi:MAG: hypothetical protein QOG87_35 [Actinomycetota bacterium]
MLARGDAEVASWPLAPSDRTGLELVDELARLQLAAQRLGCSIRLRDAWTDLSDLLDLAGLADLLCGSALEARGEAEGGEQLGIEEVVQPRDPAV